MHGGGGGGQSMFSFNPTENIDVFKIKQYFIAVVAPHTVGNQTAASIKELQVLYWNTITTG